MRIKHNTCNFKQHISSKIDGGGKKIEVVGLTILPRNFCEGIVLYLFTTCSLTFNKRIV